MAQIISPFIKYCSTIGIVPSTYEENLTYIECLNFLIKFLNDTVIPAFNENDAAFAALQVDYAKFKEDLTAEFDALQTFVDTYFENLDVQEEINNKLDEMAESGELRDAMQPYFDYLAEKVKSAYTMNELPLMRMSRSIFEIANTTYYSMQGGCYVGDGKAIKALVHADNDVQLVEFNLSTGAVIRTATLGLGHCNGLAYDDQEGKIYASGLTGDYANNLYVIDYTDLTIDETLSLNVGEGFAVSSPAIDHVTGKFYIAAEKKTSPQNIILFEMDKTTHELTPIEVNDPFNLLGSTNNNQIDAYDGIVYLVKFYPALILGVDVTAGRVSSVYNLPITSGEGYWIRDPQFITFVYDGDPGEMILGTTGEDCYRGEYYLNQFFKTNLYSGTSLKTNYNFSTETFEYYVDITATGTNPTGQSVNPFKTLGEALDMSTDRHAVTYYLVGDANTVYPFIRIYPRHGNITIRGASAKCKINGMKAAPTKKLKFVDVTFTSGTDFLVSSEQQAELILANVSVPNASNNMTLRNVALTVYNVPNDSVYNINNTGESNTFTRINTANLDKVHYVGNGQVTFINAKTIGSMTMSADATAADNGVNVALDDARLNYNYAFKYMAYFDYTRTYGHIWIPGKNGSSTFNFYISDYLVKGSLNRTNDNVIYATITKAFQIAADGTMTDVTSTLTGTLAIDLDNNI